MGQNDQVFGQILHFHLEEINKRGAKKVETNQIYSLNPGQFSIIKEVLPSCFGMKRGTGWGVMA